MRDNGSDGPKETWARNFPVVNAGSVSSAAAIGDGW